MAKLSQNLAERPTYVRPDICPWLSVSALTRERSKEEFHLLITALPGQVSVFLQSHLLERMGQLLNQGGLAMATLNRLNHVWLLLAYFGVFLIVILSLVPGTLRPHTGAGGSMEHLAAYTLVATAFGLGVGSTSRAFVG